MARSINVAIVTGASSGIGLAAARVLRERGVRLVLTSRSAAPLEQLAQQLGGPQWAVSHAGDIAAPETSAALVELAQRSFGGLDLLVNNAGVAHYGPLIEADWPDLQRVLDTNVVGLLHLIRAAVPLMPRDSVIINVGSVLAKRGLPKMAVYSASKSTLLALGDSLRSELAPRGIEVVTLLPGATSTNFNSAVIGTPPEGGRKGGPMPVSAELVARRIVELAYEPQPLAYVTLRDRMFVVATQLFPRFFDRVLGRRMN